MLALSDSNSLSKSGFPSNQIIYLLKSCLELKNKTNLDANVINERMCSIGKGNRYINIIVINDSIFFQVLIRTLHYYEKSIVSKCLLELPFSFYL